MVSHWLHRLPERPKTLILKQLRVSDILKLSFCSSKTRELVKSADISPSIRFNLENENERDTIHLAYGNSTVVFIEFAGNLNGVEIAISDTPNQCFWFFNESSPKDEEIIADYLLDLFQVDTIDVSLGSLHHPMTSFIWKNPVTRKLRRLQLSGYPSSTILSPKDLNFILNDVEADDLDLSIEVNPSNFKCANGLKNRSVCINDATWLHVDAIMNSKSEKITLEGFLFDSSELNTFLNGWKSGRMGNLETLTATGKNDVVSMEKVFKGIKLTEMVSKKREFLLPNGSYHTVVGGWEIAQDDGQKRANVSWDKDNFNFFSWSPKLVKETLKN